jgi:hypothetical protein
VTWFKVDDNFSDHPKVEDLPDAAVAMWTRGGSWSARHLTDGFVPERKARKLCDDPDRGLKALIDAGLWESVPDGYRFHDWSDYQPTREEEMAARRASSIGGAIGNHRRWHVEKGRTDPRCPYCQGAENRVPDQGTDQGTDRPTDRVPDRTPDRVTKSGASPPDPSRPDPTPLSSKSKTVGGDFGLLPTKQDQSEVSDKERDDGLTEDERLRRRWQGTECPEHRGPSIANCYECGIEHKDHRYWTRHDWSKRETT